MSQRRTRSLSTLAALGAAFGGICLTGTSLRGDTAVGRPASFEVLTARATCGATGPVAGCAPADTRVELVFSSAVEPRAVAYFAECEPAVTLHPLSFETGRRVVLQGAFATQTRYRITVPEDLRADDGALLAAAATVELETGGGTPTIRIPSGQTVLGPGQRLPVQLLALREARVRAVRLEPSDLAAASSIAGWSPAGEDPLALLPRALARRAQTSTLVAGQAPDGLVELDPFALARADGLSLVVIDAPGVDARTAVVQRGDLGVLLKVGRASGLVWATDTQSGLPVPGAAVTVYQGADVRFRGHTDASGLLALPARARLVVQDDGDSPWPELRAVVEARGRVAFASDGWSSGLEPWHFGIASAHSSGPSALRGMVTAERGPSRPPRIPHAHNLHARPGRCDFACAAYGRMAVDGGAGKGSVRMENPAKSGGASLTQVSSNADQRSALGRIEAATWDPLESTCRHASLSIL